MFNAGAPPRRTVAQRASGKRRAAAGDKSVRFGGAGWRWNALIAERRHETRTPRDGADALFAGVSRAKTKNFRSSSRATVKQL
jgi:hypothetical protein